MSGSHTQSQHEREVSLIQSMWTEGGEGGSSKGSQGHVTRRRGWGGWEGNASCAHFPELWGPLHFRERKVLVIHLYLTLGELHGGSAQ